MNYLHTKKTIRLLMAGLLLSGTASFGQVKIGNNPTNINNDAILDVESATKGLLFPRVALTSITSPSPLTGHVAGMQVYNTSTTSELDPGIYYNDGSKWIRTSGGVERTYEFGSGEPTGSCTTGTMYMDTLETSATLGQSWVCSGGSWSAYTPAPAPASTPFYLAASTSDAGGNKGSAIYRSGWVGFGGVSNPKAQIHAHGVMLQTRSGYTHTGLDKGSHAIGGIVSVYNNVNQSTWMAIQNNGGTANLYLTKRAPLSPGDAFVRFAVSGGSAGSITRTGQGVAYNQTSDVRLKENIKATHYGIADLMKIGVKDYNYIADKKTEQTGFIAQELYKVFPEAVTVGGKDFKENPWSVDYGKVTPLLVKAIQDQQAEILKLKAQLAEKNAFSAQEVAALKDLLKQAASKEVIPAR